MMLALISVSFRSQIKQRLKAIVGLIRNVDIDKNCFECSKLFIDNVVTHEQAYQSEGITPQDEDNGLETLLAKGILVELKPSNFYTIRELNHSKPYLLPKAHTLIDTLANSYFQKCQESKLLYVPFTITSATRTTKSVKSLMKTNPNSIKNSAHLRGKTFDISYTAFNKNERQSKMFILSLNQLREAGRCFVKFERNGTLHITVN
jgi:hypothetical protein